MSLTKEIGLFKRQKETFLKYKMRLLNKRVSCNENIVSSVSKSIKTINKKQIFTFNKQTSI